MQQISEVVPVFATFTEKAHFEISQVSTIELFVKIVISLTIFA